MNVYRGGRRQRGYGIGGLFSSFFRKALPFLKDTALTVGKSALDVVGNVVNDAEAGRDVVKSIKKHGKRVAMKTAKDVGFNALKRGSDVLQDIWTQDAKRSRPNDEEEDEEIDSFS